MEARLIALACETVEAESGQKGQARWTLRMLGGLMGRTGAGGFDQLCSGDEAAEKNQLKPWQAQSGCIPPQASARFVAKMEDVLEVYARPYDPAYPQICLDEKRKELRDTPQGQLPPVPDQP